ncbi:hypothetical protein MTO96_021771 [Rhipicephalus appendiculatus]
MAREIAMQRRSTTGASRQEIIEHTARGIDSIDFTGPRQTDAGGDSSIRGRDEGGGGGGKHLIHACRSIGAPCYELVPFPQTLPLKVLLHSFCDAF